MTSVPIWSGHPHITADESSMEGVQLYHGNHFLMDLIHHAPLTSGSVFSLPKSFPFSVPYSSQNVSTKSFASCSLNQMTSKGSKNSIDDCRIFVSSNPSQSSNVFEMNLNQHEPSTIDSQNLLLSKNNLNNLVVPIDQTLDVKNHLNTSVLYDEKLPLGLKSIDPKVMQQDGRVSEDNPLRERSRIDRDSSKCGDFFCQLCDTNYWTTELFSLHLEQKQFSCRICTADFTSHLDLQSHFLSHRGYRCVNCKKYFLCKKDLCDHRKSSLTCNSKFECNICNKMYSCIQSVRKHKQDAHQDVKHTYNCIVCDNKFTLQFKLNSHLKRYHVAYENIECTLCKMSVLGPEKFRIHKRQYHLRKTEPCSCSNCGKVFYCKDSLIRHEKSHYDINEVVCEFCGKSCKGRKALSDHIQYNHKDLKQINCNTCNKEFKSRKCLKKHENSSHKPKTPVICEICGRTLKNKEQLKTHLQIHSNERQFKCDICHATFKQVLALRNHSRIHSNIYKYNCSNCGKPFKWKQTFDKHVNKCIVVQNN